MIVELTGLEGDAVNRIVFTEDNPVDPMDPMHVSVTFGWEAGRSLPVELEPYLSTFIAAMQPVLEAATGVTLVAPTSVLRTGGGAQTIPL